MKLPKKFNAFTVIFLLLLSVVAAAGEQPKRIVSLAPSITEDLYRLGAEQALIAVTSYCNYPPQTKTKEVIGALSNPNIEKIYSLSPDLVLAINGINHPQTVEKLKNLGLEVKVLNKCHDFDDIKRNFTELGRIAGKRERADEIIKEIEIEINSVTQRIKDRRPVKVFWEIGARPLVSASAKSFANEFIRYAGGINIFANAPVEYPQISREDVLNKNPEVIMLVTMGNVTEAEKLRWQKFKDLEAVQNNRIYIINADKVCRPTPMGFLTGLKEVARFLHPEAFEEVE